MASSVHTIYSGYVQSMSKAFRKSFAHLILCAGHLGVMLELFQHNRASCGDRPNNLMDEDCAVIVAAEGWCW